MIDFLTLIYFIFSICLFYLAARIKNKGRITSQSKEYRKVNRSSKIKKKGEKYLDYLLTQLSKSLLEKNESNVYPSLTDILPFLDREKSHIPFFTIVYATQSNTSRKFAERIFNDTTKTLGINCLMKNISEITIQDFNRNVFLVFFLATYGEGGPTDDCIEFNNIIEDKNRVFFDQFTNQNLHYAIFGLGSSKYENFNEIAKKFDRIFTKNKMRRICEIGSGDDAKNINNDFETWRKTFWTDINIYFLSNKDYVQKTVDNLNLREIYEDTKEEYEITVNQYPFNNENLFDININEYDFNTKRYLLAQECDLVDIRELRQENINGSTLKITYSYENTTLNYQVGDNIGIYPTNSESAVMNLAKRLNYDLDSMILIKKIKLEQTKKKIPIINQFTIRELLFNIVDLSCHINKDILEKFVKYCYDEDQYEIIQNILKKENKLSEFLSKNYNVNDFLGLFDSVNLPFLEFYNIMPKIIPRFYTVASSPNFKKHKLEIIISIVEWKTHPGLSRMGLTSNYFKLIHENFKLNQNKNIKTRIVVRESSFKLPKSLKQPLIMVCTGTGIAPYISFFQEFDHIINNSQSDSTQLNNSILFFGTKNRKFDFIYEQELNFYLSKNILNKLYTAFSRDQDKKVYVQNILNDHKEELLNLILKHEAIVYICGGLSMGAEVTIFLENHLSKEILKRMEEENRLIKELWG